MSIVTNRKALHDYFIEDKFEAGAVLEGWEVKSIRDGKVQLKDSYVKIKNGEVWLFGCHVSASISTCTHVLADSDRIKKLLLNKHEINKLIGKVDQKGYSIIALNLHFSKGRIKVDIALAKGKQLHDKRATEKEREWAKEKAQIKKQYNRL
ncbi:MAG: SsrA-binding protein [Burkholderiales bacterium]|jgi:SsrA-binding protein|nr:SsrA-binding protein [Burkholderiales bacterium]